MLLIWVSTWPALGPPSGQSLHVCLPDGRDGKEYIKLSYHLISIIHFCFCYVKNITALKGCYIFLVLLITASLLRQISSCFPWYASLLKVFFLIINKKNQITVCLLFGHLYVCISLSAVFCSTDTLNYSHWPLLHLTASFFYFFCPFTIQLPSDAQAGQHTGPSRVAAVGPYIQSSTMPRGPVRHDPLVKPAYPDGTSTLPAHDPRSQSGTGEEVETIHHLQPFA